MPSGPGRSRRNTGPGPKILVAAARAGADLRALAAICAEIRYPTARPDPDDEKDQHLDRGVSFDTTFDGAGVIRGDLTPECAAMVQAVLDAPAAPTGGGDLRARPQRYTTRWKRRRASVLAGRGAGYAEDQRGAIEGVADPRRRRSLRITQLVAGTYTYSGQSIPNASVGGLDILIAKQLDSDALRVRVDRFAAPLPAQNNILTQIQALLSQVAKDLNPAITQAASVAAKEAQIVPNGKDQFTELADEKKTVLEKNPSQDLDKPPYNQLQDTYKSVSGQLPNESGEAAEA